MSLSVRIDSDADAAYIGITSRPIARTVEVNEDLILDLDQHGGIVGIELLGLSRNFPQSSVEI